MGRYFGREPRYSREELERQAQEAIDARISMGRPPAEEFLQLEQRLAEIDRAEADRRLAEAMPEPQPLRIHHVRPPAAAPATALAPPPSARQPVAAARTSAN